MRTVVVFFLFFVGLFACAGDCMSCHPVLKPGIENDRDHRVMLTCKECHTQSTNPSAPCGGNCFACHAPSSIPQSIEQHKPLPGCRECHIGVNDNTHFQFGFDKKRPDQEGILGPLGQIIYGE
jgi:hypothetical protein